MPMKVLKIIIKFVYNEIKQDLSQFIQIEFKNYYGKDEIANFYEFWCFS